MLRKNMLIVFFTVIAEAITVLAGSFGSLQGDVKGDQGSSSIIIGGCDGPTTVFIAGKGEPSEDGLMLKIDEIDENEENGISTLPMEMFMEPVYYANKKLTVLIMNQTGTESGYGNEYSLQKKIDGEWTDMKPVDEYCWTDMYNALQDMDSAIETYDLSCFGELEAGEYKLVKTGMEAAFTLIEAETQK